jgi:hypothetical protein
MENNTIRSQVKTASTAETSIQVQNPLPEKQIAKLTVPLLNGRNMYFYNPEGYKETVINGEKVYRDDSMIAGLWKTLPCPVDRLLDHVQLLTECGTRAMLFARTGIPEAGVSRLRKGVRNANGRLYRFQLEWLVRLADYSGLLLSELRTIGGMVPVVARYDEDHSKLELVGKKVRR